MPVHTATSISFTPGTTKISYNYIINFNREDSYKEAAIIEKHQKTYDHILAAAEQASKRCSSPQDKRYILDVLAEAQLTINTIMAVTT